jgi:xanthine dehydrogenase YagT iron-sulfur-binding subunit
MVLSASAASGPARKPIGEASMSDDGSTRPPDRRSWLTLTRRGFLASTGATVAAASLEACRHGDAPSTSNGAAAVLGPGRVPISLRVNGADKRVAVEPRATLAEALRLELDMTGTKIGCDRGACSACTVWLDGTPVNACMTFALDVGSRAVTTIEGLARGNALHPVQEAFIEHDAMQCGFCTPGMIMSCAALLQRNPSPTEADVRAATSGNLCRCGTYPNVFEATLAAARVGRTAKEG